MILDKIKGANDIKQLSPDEIKQLPEEIRAFLIEHVAETGGHLASNLGAVELTIALHLLLDLPTDQIVWDVGHQSYTHKILTGRKEDFSHLRQKGGISGFPNPQESECDPFVGGHASSSVSVALGLMTAKCIKEEPGRVIPVLGDGALTGGMAYEALNNAATLDENFTIVLNDNEMAISENVGGLSKHLSGMRTSNGYTGLKEGVKSGLDRLPRGEQLVNRIHQTKSGIKQLVIPGMFFEDMDIMYLGPVDGHNIDALQKVLKEAFRVKGPVVVHVKTKKGKGFLPAEKHPDYFHGIGKFDAETGVSRAKKTAGYTDVFSHAMRKIAERDDKLVAITAAMADGTGLKSFSKLYPKRFFDVGIAEEHAATFAAAMAKEDLHPVLAIYSTFLQRAFDQVLHDICMQKLPVVLAIDRAGIVGEDGMTHQGAFDISYLSLMPHMTILAPKNKWELYDMMRYAVAFRQGPIAVRYPRGEAYDGLKEARAPIAYGKAEELFSGKRVLLFALGSMVKTAVEVRGLLQTEGIEATLVNARFAKPFDEAYLEENMHDYELIVPMEENVKSGGFSEKVEVFLRSKQYTGTVLPITLPDAFIEHGNEMMIKQMLEIGPAMVSEKIVERLNE